MHTNVILTNKRCTQAQSNYTSTKLILHRYTPGLKTGGRQTDRQTSTQYPDSQTNSSPEALYNLGSGGCLA